MAPPYNAARQPARCGLRETDQMQDIGIINKGVNEIFRNTTFGEWLALGSNKTLTIIVNYKWVLIHFPLMMLVRDAIS